MGSMEKNVVDYSATSEILYIEEEIDLVMGHASGVIHDHSIPYECGFASSLGIVQDSTVNYRKWNFTSISVNFTTIQCNFTSQKQPGTTENCILISASDLHKNSGLTAIGELT